MASSSRKKRVCIVGAGMSGLVALKECLHEGLDATCYELDSEIGGIWHMKKDGGYSNTPQTWDTLITDSSKYLTSFSDFPCSSEETFYLTAQGMENYYIRYANYFDLMRCIQLDTRVIQISKAPDYRQTGKWEVYTCPTAKFKDGDKSPGLTAAPEDLAKCRKETFDFVLVCSGFLKKAKYRDIPGLDKFSGTIHHYFSFKNGMHFDKKRVLIVGNSFSAADIANDISQYASQVYLSIGRGNLWIWPRLLSGARRLDTCFTRRILYSKDAERRLNDMVISESQKRLDHFMSGICPDTPPCRSPYMIGDDIYLRIVSGRFKLFGHLRAVRGEDAIFTDGSVVSGIDSIVMCTGYAPDLSFLNMDIIQANGKMDLFKMMLPLKQTHNTLGFIGMTRGDTAIAPFSELQSRYMAKLFTGKISPPPQRVMKEDTDFWNAYSIKRKGDYSYLLPLLVVSDSIAQLLGVYPSFWRLFFRDPILAFRVWFGPHFKAQYRLLGPESDWKTARENCNRAYLEVCQSIRHRPQQKVKRDDIAEIWKSKLFKFTLVLVVAAAGCVMVHGHYHCVLRAE